MSLAETPDSIYSRSMKKIIFFIFFLVAVSACGLSPMAGSSTTQVSSGETITAAARVEITSTAPGSTTTTTPPEKSTAEQCKLPTVIVPTLPAVIPKTAELDETAGLHMTGTVQQIDLAGYRLKVSGKVDHPLSLSYDELRCMPKVSAEPTLVCPGIFDDVARWSGTPLKHVLDLAGIQVEAKDVALIGADGYRNILLMDEARNEKLFLAYEWEGQPLPILHGFPVRLVAPGMPGSNWVKWLIEIVVE